ncbi:hypothetical protein DRJ17_02315 [Candidatus Woesearchaeota archaeon]|nr:MAG: hypothetical protein DRJ17_02315 [Candidatus Woesearchaeota archaeon]
MSKTAREKLEDILRLEFDAVRTIYHEHIAKIKKGSIIEKQKLAPLHVIKFMLGHKYQDFYENIITKSIQEEAEKRNIILTCDPFKAPTFEIYFTDEFTLDALRSHGSQIIATTVYNDSLVAKTFVNQFSNGNLIRASVAQKYVYNLIKHLTNIDDERVQEMVRKISEQTLQN